MSVFICIFGGLLFNISARFLNDGFNILALKASDLFIYSKGFTS
jgi:hypothetical protein